MFDKGILKMFDVVVFFSHKTFPFLHLRPWTKACRENIS